MGLEPLVSAAQVEPDGALADAGQGDAPIGDSARRATADPRPRRRGNVSRFLARYDDALARRRLNGSAPRVLSERRCRSQAAPPPRFGTVPLADVRTSASVRWRNIMNVTVSRRIKP